MESSLVVWRTIVRQTFVPEGIRLKTVYRPDIYMQAAQALNEAELAHWLAQFEAKQIVPLVSESLLGRSLEQYSVPFARKGSDTLLFTARRTG